MDSYNKFFIYHNIRLELYSIIVIVPLGLYFVIITGNYSGENLKILIIEAVLVLIFSIILGILIRKYKLIPILNNLRDQSEENNFNQTKQSLIKYPFFESFLMTLRWFLGSALLNFLIYFTINKIETTVFLMGISFLAPAIYSFFYFTTENNISKLLTDERLVQEYLPPGSYKKMSIFMKFLLIILSITVMIIILLGYFLYQTNNNLFYLENAGKHLMYISFQSCIAIIFFVFEATSNMKRSLNLQLENLEKLKNRNFDISQPMFASDEINIAGQYLNILAGSLREYRDNNKELTDSLEEKVRERTAELSAAMEEMEAMNEELLITRDQLWSEIQVANKIQNILLPVNPQFKNYEIITYMEPAEIVGGDYYDIINTEKNNWVLIGDVSGHGVSAGLIMMMVQSALRTLIMDTPEIEPSILLDKVNNSISHNIKHMKEQKFMTILAFSFEDNGTIKCSGRHEDILIYRHKNKSVETIPTNGICISPWHLGNKDKTIKIDLHKNDILMLYTDGIIEARDQQNNLFGMDKLVSILQSNGEKSLQTIKNKLLTSLKSFKKNDDITILILKKI